MGAKRIVITTSVFIAIAIVIFLFKPHSVEQSPLQFCTWSNYYPDEVLKEFTRETGIRVSISYISSNEELFAKFKAGSTGFDLIQPSDYMVRQMHRQNMLLPLEHKLLPNIKHLDPFYTELAYDPGLKVSIPFAFGTTGIAINTEKISIPPTGVSWSMLFDSPDFRHTSLLDDLREAFGSALLYRGHSINSHDEKLLNEAKMDLGRIKKKILMFSSEPRQLLASGQIYIAHAFSFDGVLAGIENPKIKFFIPKEGGTLWTDNFSIPKGSKKVNEAHALINFLLEPKNVVKISLANNLATPNKTAYELLPSRIKNDPTLYPPPALMRRLEMLDDGSTSLIPMNRMWTELKSSY